MYIIKKNLMYDRMKYYYLRKKYLKYFKLEIFHIYLHVSSCINTNDCIVNYIYYI